MTSSTLNGSRLPVAVGGLTLSCLASAAYAQSQLEQVTVTAQKVAEDLQRVPIAITALTAETLEKKWGNQPGRHRTDYAEQRRWYRPL